MHIDWFIVVILAIALLFFWWSSWLVVKGRRDQREGAEDGEAKDSTNR